MLCELVAQVFLVFLYTIVQQSVIYYVLRKSIQTILNYWIKHFRGDKNKYLLLLNQGSSLYIIVTPCVQLHKSKSYFGLGFVRISVSLRFWLSSQRCYVDAWNAA